MRRAVRGTAGKQCNDKRQFATHHFSKEPAAVQLVEQSACGFRHDCGRAALLLGVSLFLMTSLRRTAIAAEWVQ
jgi:hypothetical protein